MIERPLVRLTEPEIHLGAHVGVLRKIHALRNGLKSNDGLEQGDWNSEIAGALGELAVAKYLGRYWNGTIGETTQPDVGPYEVRTNNSRKYTDTILRPGKVHPDRAYIGTLCFLPDFVIMGWIWGHTATRPEWFRNGTPDRPKAWFVPQSALHPMQELPLGDEFEQANRAHV